LGRDRDDARDRIVGDRRRQGRWRQNEGLAGDARRQEEPIERDLDAAVGRERAAADIRRDDVYGRTHTQGGVRLLALVAAGDERRGECEEQAEDQLSE
jgi:hypothetical protein